MTKFIDTHTEGEPTRIIIEGGPDLGAGSLTEQLQKLRANWDSFRSYVVNEPRGSDAVVGALLCSSPHPRCSTGVIFFNNKGFLSMCGHGIMGVTVALASMGLLDIGKSLIDTPAGIVEVELRDRNVVSVKNVPSYVYKQDVVVEVEEYGTVKGAVAWGGNWFFLVDESPVPVTFANLADLHNACKCIRESLIANGITGKLGAEIDHIELFGPPSTALANSKNFVYCPGGSYDRSPCGTGTSAKLASLAARNKLQPGEMWVQESIIGSHFEASYDYGDQPDQVIPTIQGKAFLCSSGTLLQEAGDPFAHGIRF